jgi:hypothetical protein
MYPKRPKTTILLKRLANNILFNGDTIKIRMPIVTIDKYMQAFCVDLAKSSII